MEISNKIKKMLLSGDFQEVIFVSPQNETFLRYDEIRIVPYEIGVKVVFLWKGEEIFYDTIKNYRSNMDTINIGSLQGSVKITLE